MTALERLMVKARKQGPCLLCGHSYARHRVWDSIDAELRAEAIRPDGYSEGGVFYVAGLYNVTVEEVRDVREAFAAARKAKRALPGRVA